MTAITRSLLSASALLLEYQELGSCNSENELRTIFMGAFMHAREAHLSCTLLREEYAKGKDFDKRLDLIMLPSWPPHQKAVATGEMKFFPQGTAKNYRNVLEPD